MTTVTARHTVEAPRDAIVCAVIAIETLEKLHPGLLGRMYSVGVHHESLRLAIGWPEDDEPPTPERWWNRKHECWETWTEGADC